MEKGIELYNDVNKFDGELKDQMLQLAELEQTVTKTKNSIKDMQGTIELTKALLETAKIALAELE